MHETVGAASAESKSELSMSKLSMSDSWLVDGVPILRHRDLDVLLILINAKGRVP